KSVREWLDRLSAKRGEGLVEPLAGGLRNWSAGGEKCGAKKRGALSADRAPPDARSELRGRVDAVKAKARAFGVAEEDSLAKLAHHAEALLYTRPTAIARAAAAVAEYEKALSVCRKPQAPA